MEISLTLKLVKSVNGPESVCPFTVIDSFTNPMNDVMGRISAMRSQFDFGEAASMAWIYFVIVLAAIGVVTGMVRKYIYYEND